MSASKIMWDGYGDHCEAEIADGFNFRVWYRPHPATSNSPSDLRDNLQSHYDAMCKVLHSLILLNTSDSTWDGVKPELHLSVPLHQDEDDCGRSTYSMDVTTDDAVNALESHLEYDEVQS